MTLRSFTVTTDRVGPLRYCRVRIHPNVEHLRKAAHRLAPWNGYDWWDGCYGCFQPAPWRCNNAGEPAWTAFAGTLRLSAHDLSAEIAAHELVHAAMQIYRMNVKPDVRIGKECNTREEDFAYIYGELSASMIAGLARSGLMLTP